MRVLIVKMSSMGDIIHTLPAVTEARRARPELRFDWVVEEGFREIPAWHPAIDTVIPVALRRWRRQWGRAVRGGEFARFRQDLRQRHYDLIIDAQGLLKSALVARMARGPVAGYDRNSIREPLASRFCARSFAVSRELHAVERIRRLFALSLGYRYRPGAPDYGLLLPTESPAERSRRQGPRADQPVLLFLHGSSWSNKRWPLPYWRELAQRAGQAGYRVRLPWGNEDEKKRAQQIAEGLSGVAVLERETLSGMALQINNSVGVVAMDSGLAHMAAAMEVPCVTIYGPTDPALSGTFGRNQASLGSKLHCAPCLRRRCHYRGPERLDRVAGSELSVQPPCFADHPPASVLTQLELLINRRRATIAHGISI